MLLVSSLFKPINEFPVVRLSDKLGNTCFLPFTFANLNAFGSNRKHSNQMFSLAVSTALASISLPYMCLRTILPILSRSFLILNKIPR